MNTQSLDRRALLRGSAAAIGTLALLRHAAPLSPAPPASMPAASTQAAAPLAGSLVAWIVLGERQAVIRLGHFDETGLLRGQAPDMQIAAALDDASAVPSMNGLLRAATVRAATTARDAAARSWGVPAEACDVLPRRIAQRGGGRSLGYAVWTDFA